MKTNTLNTHYGIIFLWFNLCAISLSGQALVQHYTVEDGLADRTVTDIIQSQKGFLWLATYTGLCRFDGNEFLTFNNHYQNPNRLNSNKIDHLLPLSDSTFLIVYNDLPFADVFNQNDFSVCSIDLPYSSEYYWQTTKLSTDNTVGCEHYYYIFRQDSLLIYHLENEDLQPLKANFQQKLTSQSCSINKDLYFSKDSDILQLFGVPNQHDSQDYLFENIDNQIFDIFVNSAAGHIYYSIKGSGNLFFVSDKNSPHQLIFESKNKNRIRKIWFDKNDNIMLALSNHEHPCFPDIEQLFLIDKARKVNDYSYLLEQVDAKINLIIGQDFEDLLLLATHNGFYKAIIKNNKIKALLYKENITGTFGTSIRGITGDEAGNIYFAREVKNWYHWDTKNQQLHTIYLKDQTQKIDSTWSNSFNLIYQDSAIWGSVCFDNSSKKCQLVKHDLVDNQTTWFDPKAGITTIVKASDGGIWVGTKYTKTTGGVLYFDTKTETFSPTQKNIEYSLKQPIPTTILEANNGDLWIGTFKGLIRLNPKTGKANIIEVKPYSDYSLSSNYVMAIQEKAPNFILLGTAAGLDILDTNTLKIKQLNKMHGLSDNRVCGIVEDASHNYWISTFNGLNYFDWDKRTFRTFYEKDGLTNNEFNRFSCYKDAQNLFYFGGINGLNIFDANNMIRQKKVPTPILTKVSKYNRQQDSILEYKTNLDKLQKVTLSPYDTYSQFHFSLPSYHEPTKHQYSTFLDGFDKDWTLIGQTPYVRYNKLPAGNYTLKIKGMDELGNWSMQALAIPIKVQAIFYKQFWFQLLLFILGCLLIYSITRYRLIQRLKTEQLRTKISSDLHDEVSGLLAGIAVQSELLQYQIKDEKTVSKIENIAQVSRSAMSRMSDVLWSIDARKDTIEDLLLRMKEHLSESLSPLDIAYTFTANNLLENKNIQVKERENIYFIFKEAINNIVKHSQAQQVHIQLGNTPNGFELRITNDGISSQNDSIKTGQGLQNMQMRAQRINAQIQILQQKDFIILLRMDKSL